MHIICIGEHVSVRQIADVVVQYLREHPGRRDMDADDLTATALALAFPCKWPLSRQPHVVMRERQKDLKRYLDALTSPLPAPWTVENMSAAFVVRALKRRTFTERPKRATYWPNLSSHGRSTRINLASFVTPMPKECREKTTRSHLRVANLQCSSASLPPNAWN
jgi:hypothetical protein